MGVINFSETNCQHCYACVRSCPVKAIKVNKGHAEIMETRCIGCGLCLQVCPKNAKEIYSELEIIQSLLQQKQKVAVSLAPSYVSVFGDQSNKVVAALKRMGFSYVEETVVGAEVVTKAYEVYKEGHPDLACITSCCPSANLLIEKYYPMNIKNLIPVVSPMVVHGCMLKERYGNDTKVVFIGPCLSKKMEALESSDIDFVLTFDELTKWFTQLGICLDQLCVLPFDDINRAYNSFPIVGGITSHFTDKKIIKVDGVLECINMLDAINTGKFGNCIIEMSACRHSCIGGSAMPDDGVSVYERKMRIEKFLTEPVISTESSHQEIKSLDLSKCFKNLSQDLIQPTVVELEKILNNMGKYKEEDQLNCGTCGYGTCIDKAIAIFNDMAEENMCLPFLMDKAQTLSNILFDMTPNIVLIVDSDLTIIEFNPAAEVFFNLKKNQVQGLPVSIVLNPDLFSMVIDSKRNIIGKKQCVNNNSSNIIESIVWVDYHEVMLCIISDVTETVKQEEWMKNLKINAVNMAQEVINKQMRIAQEIASLLGETTAETKVTLTKLKELIKEDGVE